MVAEKIIESNAREIVLAIPRFSKLAESGTNFRLLRREAEALGKTIIIETVDEAVTGLAKTNGIECRNPFFNSSMKRFSDIVTSKGGKSRVREEDIEDVPEEPRARAVEKEAKVREHFSYSEDSVEVKGPRRSRRSPFTSKPLVYGGVAAVVIIVVGIMALRILPRADIQIVAAKTNWSFSAPITVDRSLSSVDATLKKIPGQMFQDKKNLELKFPSSGSGSIQRKASGIITIWNAFGTAPQPLVAQTRFATPDGKIFRLKEKVTVPGATMANGKLVPASIDAEVQADVPGEAGNIGPVSKFTIPGFAGTPKATKFYGESKAPMTGGFIGTSAYPTSTDVSKAKVSAAEALKDSMRLVLLSGLDPSFKVVEGATNFRILSQRVNESVDNEGKFSILTEGEMSVMAFREDDVFTVLAAALEAQGATGFEVRSYDLKYGAPVFGSKGDLALPVDYESVLARKIDVQDLRERVRGKSEADLRSIIFSLPGVESAKVALWPFWVRWIPGNTSRIDVAID